MSLAIRTRTEVAEPLTTTFPFVLPRGYVDREGKLHRDGFMRLATGRDEIAPQMDPRVRQNPAFMTVLLLERTVMRLGTLPAVDSFVIEGLFASDLAFLQDLYRRINSDGRSDVPVTCPSCKHEFGVDLTGEAQGES